MFDLRIVLTLDVLAALKRSLSHALKSVKSSHRVEALARGLSFKTNAAMRIALGDSNAMSCLVSGAKFAEYLAQHHFDVSPKNLYLVCAEAAIRQVMQSYPKLTMHGIGTGPVRSHPDGIQEALRLDRTRFNESRKRLSEPEAAEQFLLALAMLKKMQPTRTIRPGTNSYRLKHIAENCPRTYPEGDDLGPNYVSNGVLIAAAIHAGFKFQVYIDEYGYDDIRVNFNMSKRVVDNLDCEVCPDGAKAQGRERRKERKIYKLAGVPGISASGTFG